MIHHIKALHNKVNGLSIRKITKQLNISRNTVSKYLKMPETEITGVLSDIDRTKKLDDIVTILFNCWKSILSYQRLKCESQG